MVLIHDYLFKKFSKHVTLNILQRICYRRCHCMSPYKECSECSVQFDKCTNCDFCIKIVHCASIDCFNLLCKTCAEKYTYNNEKSYCKNCFYMCHRCKKFARTHVHKECGYGLCDNCYKYSAVICRGKFNSYEICYSCGQKITSFGTGWINPKHLQGVRR